MDRITHQEIHDALLGADSLKDSQRAYIKGLLKEHGDNGGVDKFELRRFTERLNRDKLDGISSFEAKEIHERLSALLPDHHDEDLPKAA